LLSTKVKQFHLWHCFQSNFALVLAHLFIKEPRPGDSEGTFLVFEASCHLLLPI